MNVAQLGGQAAITDPVCCKALGIFAMIQHKCELAPTLGIDPAANAFCPGEKFLRIEREALYMDAARGLVIQIGTNSGSIFLDRSGLDAALADLSKPVIIGCLRPEDGDTMFRHGILLSLVCGTATIAKAGEATSLSGGCAA